MAQGPRENTGFGKMSLEGWVQRSMNSSFPISAIKALSDPHCGVVLESHI